MGYDRYRRLKDIVQQTHIFQKCCKASTNASSSFSLVQ